MTINNINNNRQPDVYYEEINFSCFSRKGVGLVDYIFCIQGARPLQYPADNPVAMSAD